MNEQKLQTTVNIFECVFVSTGTSKCVSEPLKEIVLCDDFPLYFFTAEMMFPYTYSICIKNLVYIILVFSHEYYFILFVSVFFFFLHPCVNVLFISSYK